MLWGWVKLSSKRGEGIGVNNRKEAGPFEMNLMARYRKSEDRFKEDDQ